MDLDDLEKAYSLLEEEHDTILSILQKFCDKERKQSILGAVAESGAAYNVLAFVNDEGQDVCRFKSKARKQLNQLKSQLHIVLLFGTILAGTPSRHPVINNRHNYRVRVVSNKLNSIPKSYTYRHILP